MTLIVNGEQIATDKAGYLDNLADWDKDVATAIASQENIPLNDAHWEIINTTRAFYQRFQKSPAMRPLIKFLRQQLGDDKGKSLYLYKLFPDGAKQVSKIAGLPKPDHCL